VRGRGKKKREGLGGKFFKGETKHASLARILEKKRKRAGAATQNVKNPEGLIGKGREGEKILPAGQKKKACRERGGEKKRGAEAGESKNCFGSCFLDHWALHKGTEKNVK